MATIEQTIDLTTSSCSEMTLPTAALVNLEGR